jgi:conjugative transfer signal peptidase TraF
MMVVGPYAIATLMVATTGIGLLAAPELVELPTRFILNASASAPIGLYAMQPAGGLELDDWVLFVPPQPIGAWLVERKYLAPDMPLIKRVAALSGQIVCRNDRLITIDGVATAPAREHDRQERRLPAWTGCVVLENNDVFLLNSDVPDSLDGRYFGPTDRSSINGQLLPLWTLTRP